jgi:hypothetical protein
VEFSKVSGIPVFRPPLAKLLETLSLTMSWCDNITERIYINMHPTTPLK